MPTNATQSWQNGWNDTTKRKRWSLGPGHTLLYYTLPTTEACWNLSYRGHVAFWLQSPWSKHLLYLNSWFLVLCHYMRPPPLIKTGGRISTFPWQQRRRRRRIHYGRTTPTRRRRPPTSYFSISIWRKLPGLVWIDTWQENITPYVGTRDIAWTNHFTMPNKQRLEANMSTWRSSNNGAFTIANFSVLN